jgi:RNA-directed DNA polymerase
LSAPTVSTRLPRMAAQARQHPAMPFTTLAHRIDVDLLREAYPQTRRDGAPGVDGVTAEAYAADLEANLADVHARLCRGRYDAPPVKRTDVPKEDGRQRPMGMPAFEDKVVQRAVAMLLGAIYEPDVHDCSYGFREGRSPHQALHVWRERCMQEHSGWSVDAEVSACFDSVDQDLWCEVLRQRVNDGAILRVIRKWLWAGVLEGETRSDPERGSPQGGVVSPRRANTCLDHVLNAWFEREVKPRMKGRCLRIRFADDVVIGGEREGEARRMLVVLPKRCARCKLTIHPQKTRLVQFQPSRQEDAGERGDGTFDFLGLTHDWATSRRGDWVITRRTAKKRLRRALRAVWPGCRTHRHDPLRDQYRMLCQKLRGHYQYDGIRGNYRRLEALYWGVERAWRYWLSRRGGPRTLRWETFASLRAVLVLPLPRIVHNIECVLQGHQCAASESCRHSDFRRTGCVNCARPGLWGAWRVTAGSTRQATARSVRCASASGRGSCLAFGQYLANLWQKVCLLS